jgi:hypothetical protein
MGMGSRIIHTQPSKIRYGECNTRLAKIVYFGAGDFSCIFFPDKIENSTKVPLSKRNVPGMIGRNIFCP